MHLRIVGMTLRAFLLLHHSASARRIALRARSELLPAPWSAFADEVSRPLNSASYHNHGVLRPFLYLRFVHIGFQGDDFEQPYQNRIYDL